jgi:signal transduction histidine kinase
LETSVPTSLPAAPLLTASKLRHDLRTPLNQIIGYTEMLIEDSEEQHAGDALADLQRIHGFSYDIVKQLQQLLPPSVQAVDPDLLLNVQEGLRPAAVRLLTVARSVAALPHDFLQPFARHIEEAAAELAQFSAGRASLSKASLPADNTVDDQQKHSANVLVVDDTQGNRELLAKQLARQGYSVISASNGREALNLLRSQHVDIVLLDVLMPELDGFQTLEIIQADEKLREIPVIMTSASEEYQSLIRCIEGGAEDYLPKPFDPVLLRARLKNSFEKKAMRDEQRHRTEELETAYRELRNMQDQLVTQEKLASLGSLAAGIAHEIKNPLNFVTNFASLSNELIGELRSALASHNESECQDLLADLTLNLEKIEDHGKRADRIVRGMLMHSRKQSGERESIDLNALVTECVQLAFHGLRSQDMTFNATIDFHLDPEVGKVEIFPQDLSRVFLNLATNAFYAVHEKRKSHGPQYAPTVNVTSTTEGDWVEVRVKDNGTGIPPGVQRKIFEPFYTTKPTGSGTGLGLSISREIVVQEHRGELSVNSEEGVMAEFIVRLPRKAA